MPLIKRIIESPPIDPKVSRFPLDDQGNPLYSRPEYYQTSSGPSFILQGQNPPDVGQSVHLIQIAKLVKQLADVGQYSSEMFQDLDKELGQATQKMDNLKKRLDTLKGFLPTVEENMITQKITDSLGNERSDWRSFQPVQQLFSMDTANPAILKVYNQCPPLPNLGLLDAYREDKQACMKFFSYPLFFMERWQARMENEPKKKKKKIKKSKENKAKEIKVSEVKVKRYNNAGELIVDSIEDLTQVGKSLVPKQGTLDNSASANSYDTNTINSATYKMQQMNINAPTSIVPPPPNFSPPVQFVDPTSEQAARRLSVASKIFAPPPPPVPPAAPPPPPTPVMSDSQMAEDVEITGSPAPPPAPSLPSSLSANAISQAASLLKSRSAQREVVSKDPRGNMLDSIKGGTFNLRKAQESARKPVEAQKPGTDVASILQRRIALEMSDSSGDSEDEEEDNEWD